MDRQLLSNTFYTTTENGGLGETPQIHTVQFLIPHKEGSQPEPLRNGGTVSILDFGWGAISTGSLSSVARLSDVAGLSDIAGLSSGSGSGGKLYENETLYFSNSNTGFDQGPYPTGDMTFQSFESPDLFFLT